MSGQLSKTTYYRRLRKSNELGCSIEEVPDNRGKHGQHARGSKHYRWNSNKIASQNNYVLIRVGVTHPLADPNGYCREHVLIMCSALGRKLKNGEVIHHKNGDTTDNRLENLALTTIGEHNKVHNKDKGRDSKGQFVGKKKAGRLLDGQEWNEMPGVKA